MTDEKQFDPDGADDPSTGKGHTLRQRAEEIEEKAPRRHEDKHVLHELRVHQIELMMQNEELQRAQLELDASRTRYFDLYDLAPVGYCTLNEKGLVLEANLTAATLLGVARGALAKQPISRFILKEDQDIYYRYRKELFETGLPKACELRMVKKGGTILWVRMEAIISQDADRKPVCRVVLSDITERKFQEDEHELTSRLIRLVNTPGDFRERMSDLTASLQGWSGCEAVGIRLQAGDDYPYYETRGFTPAFVLEENHLCAVGPDGVILRDAAGNPVLECMCGNILRGLFDPEKPFFTAKGSFWSNNTSALLAGTTEADRQARTRNRCNGEGYESVALIPLRTGHQVFGLVQFNDRRPDRFTPGLIAHFERLVESLAIALSRRQAEEALRESEEKYRGILESIDEGYFEIDLAGNFTFVNDAECINLGYARDELIGMNYRKLTDETDAKKKHEIFSRLYKTDEPIKAFDGNFIRKDGTKGFNEFSASLIRDGGGKPIGFRGLSRDVTERKRSEEDKQNLEERLQRAEKMEALGLLAGGVAHDLNNALGILVGYAELLYDGLDESSPLRDDARNIMMGGEQAAAIVQDLLTLARRGAQARTVINMNKIITEYLKSPEFMKLSSFHPHVRIKTDLEEDLIKIAGSQAHLSKTLMNLVYNAAEAMTSGGELTIRTENRYVDRPVSGYDAVEEGDYVVLSVSDEGEGIKDDDLQRIFEPFYTKKVMGRSGT